MWRLQAKEVMLVFWGLMLHHRAQHRHQQVKAMCQSWFQIHQRQDKAQYRPKHHHQKAKAQYQSRFQIHQRQPKHQHHHQKHQLKHQLLQKQSHPALWIMLQKQNHPALSHTRQVGEQRQALGRHNQHQEAPKPGDGHLQHEKEERQLSQHHEQER